jgi:hypothetical protein
MMLIKSTTIADTKAFIVTGWHIQLILRYLPTLNTLQVTSYFPINCYIYYNRGLSNEFDQLITSAKMDKGVKDTLAGSPGENGG